MYFLTEKEYFFIPKVKEKEKSVVLKILLQRRVKMAYSKDFNYFQFTCSPLGICLLTISFIPKFSGNNNGLICDTTVNSFLFKIKSLEKMKDVERCRLPQSCSEVNWSIYFAML